MTVSVQEILLVVFSTVLATVLARRFRRPWLLGIPLQVVVISFGTPADLVSTLLIAVPCGLLYGAGVLNSRPDTEGAC